MAPLIKFCTSDVNYIVTGNLQSITEVLIMGDYQHFFFSPPVHHEFDGYNLIKLKFFISDHCAIFLFQILKPE